MTDAVEGADAEAARARLEAQIGWSFSDPVLVRSALTHRSFLNETDVIDSGDNERLEFLGDAVLDFVVGEYLFRRLPDAREGELTTMRALLVCEPTLASFAARIDLGSHVRLGRGEAASGGRDRPAILCDAFEALVGAMFLDAGIERTRSFVLRFVADEAERALESRRDKDAKSTFQEVAQRLWQITPQYKTVSESGPDHDKRFLVAVLVGGEEWGLGDGRSKAAAAHRAAQAALARFERDSSARPAGASVGPSSSAETSSPP